MSAPRWEQLRGSLERAGIAADVTSMSYAEDRAGRPHHGVSHSITLRAARGRVVVVRDAWWNQSPQVWMGWTVEHSGPDAITHGLTRALKRPCEVVAAVRLHLEGASLLGATGHGAVAR